MSYLCVDTCVLPDYFEKVIATKRCLESGRTHNVSEAARLNGISRSTYYKYKDYVFETGSNTGSHCGTFLMLLSHEKGILSSVLSIFSDAGANILTISQSIPISNMASVTLTADLSQMNCDIDELMKHLEQLNGLDQIQLVAMN